MGISVHSKYDDHYKVFATSSESHFVPIQSVWIDTETRSGITRSTYRFVMDCDVKRTAFPSKPSLDKKIQTDSFVDTTWFWITIILILLFLIIFIVFLWLFLKKRKRNPDMVNFDGNPNEMELQQKGEHEQENKEDLV